MSRESKLEVFYHLIEESRLIIDPPLFLSCFPLFLQKNLTEFFVILPFSLHLFAYLNLITPTFQ